MAIKWNEDSVIKAFSDVLGEGNTSVQTSPASLDKLLNTAKAKQTGVVNG